MKFIWLVLLLIPIRSRAAEITSIGEIGPHVKLFTFEKSENPQNILIGYTKLDQDCHFVRAGDQPLLDYYWMMDGKKYKPVHSMIKSEVRRRLQMVSSKTDLDQFGLRVQDFNGLASDLANEKVKVTSKKTDHGCVATVEVSNDAKSEQPMEVETIAAESKLTLVPPFRKFISLKFIGRDLKTGASETRVIR